MNIRAIVIAAALMAGVSFTANAQQLSITRSVIGSGMTPIVDLADNVILDGTLGQAIIGPVTTSSVFVGQGFWYELLPEVNAVQEQPSDRLTASHSSRTIRILSIHRRP